MSGQLWFEMRENCKSTLHMGNSFSPTFSQASMHACNLSWLPAPPKPDDQGLTKEWCSELRNSLLEEPQALLCWMRNTPCHTACLSFRV